MNFGDGVLVIEVGRHRPELIDNVLPDVRLESNGDVRQIERWTLPRLTGKLQAVPDPLPPVTVGRPVQIWKGRPSGIPGIRQPGEDAARIHRRIPPAVLPITGQRHRLRVFGCGAGSLYTGRRRDDRQNKCYLCNELSRHLASLICKKLTAVGDAHAADTSRQLIELLSIEYYPGMDINPVAAVLEPVETNRARDPVEVLEPR